MELKHRRLRLSGARGLCCITLLLAAAARSDRLLRPGLSQGLGPAAVLQSNGGQMESLVGISSLLANLATAGAMLYLVHKVSQMMGGATPGPAARVASEVQLHSSPGQGPAQFQRQITPLEDLGDGVLHVGSQPTSRTRTESLVVSQKRARKT